MRIGIYISRWTCLTFSSTFIYDLWTTIKKVIPAQYSSTRLAFIFPFFQQTKKKKSISTSKKVSKRLIYSIVLSTKDATPDTHSQSLCSPITMHTYIIYNPNTPPRPIPSHPLCQTRTTHTPTHELTNSQTHSHVHRPPNHPPLLPSHLSLPAAYLLLRLRQPPLLSRSASQAGARQRGAVQEVYVGKESY